MQGDNEDLRKARPILKATTSFSIVANCATALSGCDSSTEVGILRAEGEGEVTAAQIVGVFSVVSELTAEACPSYQEIGTQFHQQFLVDVYAQYLTSL